MFTPLKGGRKMFYPFSKGEGYKILDPSYLGSMYLGNTNT